MGILCIVVIGFVIYVNFSYYYDFLHADIAADLAFVREAARTLSLFPQGWLHLNEMRFFYITTPILLLYIIIGNINLSYKLVVTFMLLVNVFLFWWAFKGSRLIATFVGIIVFIIAFSGYYLFSVFDILWINASLSTHLATVLFTIGAYTRLHGNRKIHITLVVLAIIFAFLQGVQSIRVTIALYLPMLFVALYPLSKSIFSKQKLYLTSSRSFAVLLFLSNIAGILLIQIFIRNGTVLLGYESTTTGLRLASARDIFNGDLMFSMAGVLESLQFHGDIYVFSQEGILHLSRIVFLAFIFILFFNAKKTTHVKELLFFLLCSVIFLFLSQVITQGIGMGGRLNFTITTFLAFLSIVVVDQMVKHNRYTISFIFCSFVCFIVILSISNFGLHRNHSLVNDRIAASNFIVEQGLTLGYGHFWTGMPVAAVSNYQFVIIPLHHTEDIFGETFSQGVSIYDFARQVDQSFILAPEIEFYWAFRQNTTIANLMNLGQRHQFGDIVVYVFDHDPFENQRR